MSDFLAIATRNAARGLRVFPVHRGSKKPCILNFPDHATTDPATIEEWARKFPDANCGVMGDDTFLIVDSDRWSKMQELFTEALKTHPTLFETYCISAREDRRQFVFLQTERSRSMRKRNLDYAVPGEDGNVFELKSWHKLGMGEGSLHKTGSTYAIVQDLPFKPVPDLLIDRAEELAATVRAQRQDGRIPREKILEGGRRNALVQEAGRILRVTEMSKAVLIAHLQDFNEQWLDPPLSDDEVRDVALKCNWEPEPPAPLIVIGSTETPLPAGKAEKTPHPTYPDEVWDGTLFGAFADIVNRDNFIPKKFASESFRILTGAIVGDQLTCGVAGGRMRDYLAVIGLRQSGKSWAKDCAVWFYTRPSTHFLFEPLLFHGGPNGYRSMRIGAQQFLPGSPNSFVDELTREDRKKKPIREAAIPLEITEMERWDPMARFITIQGEAMSLFARFGNEWGGQALSALITDLYDGTEVEVAVTSDRGAAKIPVRVQYSMMLYTQPLIWRKYMAEHVMDSGLFGRFYIVGSEQKPTQVPLPDYEKDTELFQKHFGEIRREMFARVEYLSDHPLQMIISSEAKCKIHDWLGTIGDQDDGIDRASRMGLHVYRAAMARAWGARKQRLEISAEDAEAAILLGEYQIRQREYYAPVVGDDGKARALNLVRQTIRNAGQITLRDLRRKVSSDRFSERFEWAMEWMTKRREIVIEKHGKSQLIIWAKEE
jgi:hypothetical protein